MSTHVIYARKSTESDDRQVLSIDSQIQELKLVALRQGLVVSDVLTEARSAKAPGRLGLDPHIRGGGGRRGGRVDPVLESGPAGQEPRRYGPRPASAGRPPAAVGHHAGPDLHGRR